MSALPDTAIAIVGMSCHFPGAEGPDAFWADLRAGKESITRFTDEQLLAAGVPASVLAKPNYVKANGVLERADWFDAGFFGLSPRDAAVMDPQTRHFLECAWHALEDGGHLPARFDGRIGVFAGAGAARYFWQNVVRDPDLLREVGYFLLRHTGNDKDFLATRASYEFDLRGPSVSVQTACSTSLVAVHYACQSLLAWECDMALAGGVTIEQPQVEGYLFLEGEILSPDGHCRSYDHRAAGTVFGSGAGVVLLRRLSDAVADGDRIHAVIRGSAVNNDGAGKVSYLAPSVDGQVKVITEALEVAGVDPDSIGLVEGHGTATPVGDPIEVTALTKAFRASTSKSGFCALGSVKSNVGHLDTAAGVASLIKAVLAVKHGEIPPTVHFERPNPLAQLEGSPFYVNSEVRSWSKELAPRRAGVTSLGVGGTNAHVVIEQAPPPRPTTPSRPWQLLTLSARSAHALEDASRALIDHLEAHPDESLADVAHTLHVGRRRFAHRRTLVCRSSADAIEGLAGANNASVTASGGDGRTLAFLFAGGGAQYPNMGRELYESEREFRVVVDQCLDHVKRSEGVDLRALLFCSPADQEAASRALQRPSAALPALFAIQLAQARLWMSWGLTPSALIGHSMGEYTAACLAGVFSPEDGVSLVAVRGRLFESLAGGGMLSVSLGERALRSLLSADLSIAAVNAPEVSVASGPVASIDALERRLREEGIDCQRVRIDVAAHSSMLEPILEPFGDHVSGLRLSAPELPVISNLTGDVAGREMTDPRYWVRHLRETVRFSDGIGRLMRKDGPILLEVGPGRTLSTVAKMHPAWTAEQPTLHSLPHPTEPEDALAFQMRTLGALWAHGVDIDWDAFRGKEVRNKVPLPGYPFERAPHFVPAPHAGVEGAVQLAGGTTLRAEQDDWFYKTSWTPKLIDPAWNTARTGHVLLLADDRETTSHLVDRLTCAGSRVTRVLSGDGFGRTQDGTYRLRPDHKADWTALVRSLRTEDVMPDVILHGWCVGARGGGEGPTTSVLPFFAPLYLFQALEEEASGSKVRLIALASGAIAVTGSDRVDPERALLLGPVRVAPKELPNVSARLVDVGDIPDDPVLARSLLDQVAAEVQVEAPERVVAYRGGDRLEESFTRVRLRTGCAGAGIRDGGTYLITGGLGGIGLVVARELAEAKRVNLVLLSRSSLPAAQDRDRWLKEHPTGDKTSRGLREVQALERLGAEVLLVTGDVADEARMRQVVGQVVERFGGLTGVFHTAGVLNDGPLLARSVDDALGVLRPKVAGTRALDAALEGLDLDFFFLFSSVSAVVGAPGQIDYAAANSFLDAFARSRTARTGQRTVSISWGAWKDVGMAAELAGEARYDGISDERATPIEHSYFDELVERSNGERAFRTRFSAGRHWMLDEHRLRAGPWVLPGSGYVELIRAAHELASSARTFEMRNLVFLRPFRVSAGETRDFEIRLAPKGDDWAITVWSRSESAEPWIEHASASVLGNGTTNGAASPVAGALDGVRARIGGSTKVARPQHPAMDFGPRWNNIVAESTKGQEALLQHVLPEAFLGDLAQSGLHPALLDMATAGAQHLIPGLDTSRDFLVPAGYGALRMAGTLSSSLTSHVSLRSAEEDGKLASFDISIYDDKGSAVVSVEDFTMIHVAGELVGESHAAETPAWLRDAIAPAEGRDVLRRILSRDTGPHLWVATRPLDVLIAEASTTPVRARRSVETAHAAPARVLMPSVVEALEAHEAVREAAALGSPDSDSARVVAFVVYAPGAQATVSELRRFVRGRLDKRLIPQNFVEMAALPRAADGSLIANELRDPFAAVDDYVAPQTSTQEVIGRIWSELLALSRVGIHDNFLDVGGHSLVGIRVLRRIQQETGVRLEANALTMQTLEQIAAEVDRKAAG